MRWSLRLSVFALMAGLQAVGLIPVSMLLMPLLTELLLAISQDRVTPVLIAGVSCCMCWLSVPEWLRIACMVWCVMPVLMAWLPVGSDARRRGALWCGLCAAMCAALMVLLGIHYEGHGVQGIVDRMIEWLSARDDAKEWLYQLAGYGLLPLKANQAELATMRMFGAWGMSIGVKQQLLSSMNLILTQWLTAVLPGTMVLLCGVTGVLCAALPDAIRAGRAGYSDLPPLRNWYMDRSWTMGMILLLVPALLAWLSGEAWLGLFAELCTAMFQLVMGVQGACVLLHTRYKFDAGAPAVILSVLMILVMPSVLVWVGTIDQVADFRKLRPHDDDDQYDEF